MPYLWGMVTLRLVGDIEMSQWKYALHSSFQMKWWPKEDRMGLVGDIIIWGLRIALLHGPPFYKESVFSAKYSNDAFSETCT